ncbi:hypothetical protein SAMN02745121_01304 [Nannocystis exedens]|uniref:Uncharacterized protein n=1 Tax=Nannocystis exedens TaxID=54 RepID=A0A1I1UUN3_9BACT|nr:hypothetical protein [Nannocystis exedens]PCC72095.1 hypothetical protein NAEX_05174 [Nannocystis exedens]SFD74285.1 hypothetical protein SAMN02745121_01304 [Nannocystis exedens]
MLSFTTPDRLQALAVVMCLSACSEEVAMTETEVAAADEAAVLRMFERVLRGVAGVPSGPLRPQGGS